MTITARDAWEIRAAAHAGLPQRVAQRWQHGVTDEAVALVMYSIEQGHDFYCNRVGRWRADRDSPVRQSAMGRDVPTVVNEMIRTGLVRVVADRLVPALVHVRDRENGQWSACRFTGEDLGPIRARLVDHDRLDLVDCLECLQAVAQGGPRGL